MNISNLKFVRPVLSKFRRLNSKQKYLIAGAAVAAVFILVFSLAKGGKNENQPDNKTVSEPSGGQSENNGADRENQFGRISFFELQPESGSMAIPASWEGKYRIKKTDSEADLDYIGCGELKTSIFKIRKYPLAESGRSDLGRQKEIARGKKYFFTYEKSLVNPYNGQCAAEYQKMIDRVDELVATLKIRN